MTDEDVFAWHALLPPEIVSLAYRAGKEFAWDRANALKVAAIIESNGLKIIGVDTWLPTRPGPTPLIQDWDETDKLSAFDFIKTFQPNPLYGGHDGMAVYFNFCV